MHDTFITKTHLFFFNLICLVPADILFITSEQSVVFGADVKLNCWSKGVPAPDVAWMRNEKVLVKGERTVILKLDNVTWQDEDVYTCIANNSGRSDSGETKVNVVGGCLKLPNRIVPNCCFGCHATLLERSVAWPISGATAHGIVMLLALLENKRTVFFFTVVFFLFQRVHRRAAVFLQPMNYELIANLQIWLLFHSTSRWLLQKCKFIYFHCKSWLISYKIIVDYVLSYLDSDLSDNKIEALNVEDLTSLNFLHKLLVMFTIYNYCFPRLIITYTLTKDLALYLSFFYGKDWPDKSFALVMVHFDLKYFRKEPFMYLSVTYVYAMLPETSKERPAPRPALT